MFAGKVAAHNTTSRRDLPYTLAFKNQLKFCHRLIARKGLVSELEVGPGKDVTTLKDLMKFSAKIPAFLKTNSFSVSWVRLHSIMYKKGMFW
jgi:hypothetical protein